MTEVYVTNPYSPLYGKHIGTIMPTVDSRVIAASPGIQTHSQQLQPLVIISAYTGTVSEAENMLRHADLYDRLHNAGLETGEVTGCYFGQRESSWLVEYATADYAVLNWLLQLAAEYEQESILHIDAARHATLLYPYGNDAEALGKLVPVSPQAAQQLDSWTRIKSGQYYAVL